MCLATMIALKLNSFLRLLRKTTENHHSLDSQSVHNPHITHLLEGQRKKPVLVSRSRTRAGARVSHTYVPENVNRNVSAQENIHAQKCVWRRAIMDREAFSLGKQKRIAEILDSFSQTRIR